MFNISPKRWKINKLLTLSSINSKEKYKAERVLWENDKPN